jgi:WD40 repeat protein
MRQPTAGGSPETALEMSYSVAKFASFFCPEKPGRPCVLSSTEGKNLLFYEFDPLRGKGNLLGTIGVDSSTFFGCAISPDGSQLAVADSGHKDRVEILTLSSRTWHEINMAPGWGSAQSVAWAADGKGFFMTTWLPESFDLIHVSLSGKVQLLSNNPHRQWVHRPQSSPDGKHLAFQAQTWDSNVWLLENF